MRKNVSRRPSARRKTEKKRRSSRGLLFGVFDFLHGGHLHLLRFARRRCDTLIVVIARDSYVRKFKGKASARGERGRAQNIRRTGIADLVALSDAHIGSYGVVKRYKPDVIFLGYDQRALGADLRKKIAAERLPPMRLIRATSYRPRKFHTSLLRSRGHRDNLSSLHAESLHSWDAKSLPRRQAGSRAFQGCKPVALLARTRKGGYSKRK